MAKNRLDPETLIRWSKIYKRPIDTMGAVKVWKILSGADAFYPAPIALQIYNAMGYYPFAGFPLQRKD